MTDRGFEAAGGGLRAHLDEAEADVLRRLVGEVRTLLVGRERGDPALQRLLPDAYEERPDSAAYREMVEDDLVAGKLSALDDVAVALGEKGAVDVELDGEAAHVWLTALTDMRLAIGTRLEVTEETMSADIDPDDPYAMALSVLHWLGWLQESMIDVLDEEGM